MQPSEVSHVYAECARAVSFAKSAQIAESHHIISEQLPSEYLIDAYLMCLTAGARQISVMHDHSSKGYNRNQALADNRTAQLNFHLSMTTPRITESASITEYDGTFNQTIFNERRIAREMERKFLNG
ncbi:MAG: hypothetical protein EZS28_008635 [Streblomastix strix]|uniref:Uncharacterized protein n=1 Tax=Streblomastix strix TaxID=222440 RepID=A0A5J4WN75_9EUKA|nr:MAG: hypothetical protein EZS28_008635 [Streblomastix strix]